MPPMMTITDIAEQLEQIDEQIVKLLEERSHLCEGQPITANDELNMLSLWLEEAAEKGLDEGKIEKIAKLVIALSRTVPQE